MNLNKFFSSLILLFLVSTTFANNLQISNPTRPANNQIQFDISWENSWYVNMDPKNWDAVWVFVKVQDCNTALNAWEHADISTTSGDHSIADANMRIDAASDGKGVFIRRDVLGVGNIATTSVTLTFQTTYAALDVNFEVFGIEMVAVLEGEFTLGGYSNYSNTGNNSSGHYQFKSYKIESEDALAAGTLNTPVVSNTTFPGYVPALPAAFPKGYNQFYMMKYEITQQQYAHFLNLLNYGQQSARTEYPPNSAAGHNALSNTFINNRNGVKIETPGAFNPPTDNSPAVYGNNLVGAATSFNEAGDGQHIACNYLSWTDLLAYLDWSALRPMTELEFEKAARGPLTPIIGEYAFGSTGIAQAHSDLLDNGGEASEVSTVNPTAGSGLVAYGYSGGGWWAPYGPLRVGFAGATGTDRFSSGAGYYGAMDLSGNVWEQCISAGYANGNQAAFTGILGDGELAEDGNSNQTGWNLDPTYSIVRGGDYQNGSSFCIIGSRRFVNSTTYNLTRDSRTGGRGVRQF